MLPEIQKTIQTADLSTQIDTLIELVDLKNQQFVIQKNNQRIARLVPEIYLQVIDDLVDNDPELAETIALMMDKVAHTAIEEGINDWKAGHVRPTQRLFDEIRTTNR